MQPNFNNNFNAFFTKFNGENALKNQLAARPPAPPAQGTSSLIPNETVQEGGASISALVTSRPPVPRPRLADSA
eukprot:791004-Prymnesium_polylepis.1